MAAIALVARSLAPSSPSSSHMAPKAVHFDSDCVVIPDANPKHQARFTSRTYSLPLWRAAPDKEPAHLKLRVPSFASPRPRVSSRARETPPSPSCLRTQHEHCVHVPDSPRSRSASPRHPRRDVSDPGTGTLTRSEFPRELAVTRTDMRARSASHSSLPLVVVPLRSCCGECHHSVDIALSDDYEEKWTRGARRRRRSGSIGGDTPVGTGRFSVELLRVDELPTPRPSPSQEESCPIIVTAAASGQSSSAHDDEDDCFLFPLPCGKKRKAQNHALSASDSDSGSSTPLSSTEDVVPIRTPSLTPTSDSDEPPLPSPVARPTMISLPFVTPASPTDEGDPDALPPQLIVKTSPTTETLPRRPSISSSPVRQRLLSGAGSFLRGAVSAAAAPTSGSAIRL